MSNLAVVWLGRFSQVTLAFGGVPLFLPLAITAFGGREGYFSLAIIAFRAFGFIVRKYYYRQGRMDKRSLRGGGGGTEGGGFHTPGARYNICPQWCRDTRTVTRVRHHPFC